MKKIYIVTGANGHLGGTLVRMLSKRGEAVRGLVLPGEAPQPFPHVRYYTGDVRDADSMRPLFADAEDAELLVLHTAGLVDIADAVSDRLYDVNVNGTKNVLALCWEYGVRRLVYVSSVHAIPEEKSPAVLKEVASFSPERVTGGYAKTKAEATQAVLDAVQAGLDAVVVHPSGIIGPFGPARPRLPARRASGLRARRVRLCRRARRGGRLPACARARPARRELHPLEPPLRGQGGAGHRAQRSRRPAAPGPANGHCPRRGAASAVGCPAVRPAPALHGVFAVHAEKQRPLFARQGHRGAGLQAAGPPRYAARHGALAAPEAGRAGINSTARRRSVDMRPVTGVFFIKSSKQEKARRLRFAGPGLRLVCFAGSGDYRPNFTMLS